MDTLRVETITLQAIGTVVNSFEVPFLSPMRLHEYGIDLFQLHNPFLISNSFEQRFVAESGLAVYLLSQPKPF